MTAEILKEDYWLEGRITDEGLEKMYAALGRKRQVPGWNSEVTRDSIWHFAQGIGDDNPLWWDDDYAEASPWGRLVAPPGYIVSHTTGPLVKPEHGQMSTAAYLPGVMGVYAGSRWEWRRPVHVGERISATAELDKVEVNDSSRFGGRSVTQVEKLALQTERGEVVAEIFHTLKRFERREVAAGGGYLDRPLATYTAADRARIDRHYDGEAASLRRGAEPRYIEDVTVGERLGPMLKGPLTVGNIMGFLLGYGSQLLGANRLHHESLARHPSTQVIHPVTGIADQYGAVHWDADLAWAGGMPAPYDVGPQRFSWITHLLTDWAGDHGFLLSQDFRFKAPNFLGDITWINGEVVEVDLLAGLATVQITATNQLDAVNSTARAVVRLPRRQAAIGSV
jgi:acyl dehydratase